MESTEYTTAENSVSDIEKCEMPNTSDHDSARECAQLDTLSEVQEVEYDVVSEIQEAFEPYQVQVSIPYLNIRRGPGITYEKLGIFTGSGLFTIVKEEEGEGSSAGWGLLEDYAGKEDRWISLEYTTRINQDEGNNVHAQR